MCMWFILLCMYDSVLNLLLSYGHHDWFNKVFFSSLLMTTADQAVGENEIPL